MKKSLTLVLMVLFLVPFTTIALADTLTKGILGDISVISFQVYLIYAYAGVVLNVLSDIIRRDPSATNSPEKFDLDYWWSKNWRRLVIGAVMVPITVLIFSDIFGMQLDKFGALFIGLSSDHLLEILKRKNKLGL